ncbi:hypothetical protein DYB28_003390 [Aphanomyces astaci]|uniref:Uncharacterized protein n=1 Tax=Aphanomyces astaci TaxID=112090 RepID=A0A397C7H3_APHAT|nr:hypothetical protein DYB25_002325 [Aphanomyces astaci]RHY10268.1 hypothetical protein DYB36_007599 [Aphanomyces astaci]RHY37500.1 hypothetical protein DYB38_004272 [Aphanomyces astaci]RHY43800.1 hypothetical protein DYB34_002518 [Aphanomyces astaci]RHY66077.1 hypothetical protein DYB30_002424 [Aphanomyces astaci]
MSTLVLEPDFASTFAVLVGATAFAVPACLLLPSPLMRTTCVLVVALVAFVVLSIVIPLCVYLCVLFSNEDFVVSVYSARQVAVSSSEDIFIKLCPIVAMMQTMRNLIRCFGAAPPVSHALKLKKLPTMSTITETGELTTSSRATSILSSHTAALALGSFKRQIENCSTGSVSTPTCCTMFTPDMFRTMLTLLSWDKRAVVIDVTNNPIAPMPRDVSATLLATHSVLCSPTQAKSSQMDRQLLAIPSTRGYW